MPTLPEDLVILAVGAKPRSGLVLTAAGLLVQSGAIAPAAGADRRALAWHAYLWDPWFLLWGALVAAVLLRSRPPGRRQR